MSNMKLDNTRLDKIIDRSETARTETGNPTEKDISLFEREMKTHGEKQNSHEQEQKQEQNNDGSQSAPSSAFESIFSMAFSSVKESGIQEITAPIPKPNELTENLVERILVSDPKSADQEVRIKLNESVLPDTEIRIIRHNDGSLHIQLNSENANSFQTLAAQQFELKTRLERIENSPIIVEVNSRNREESDRNRRSRGLFDPYLSNEENK